MTNAANNKERDEHYRFRPGVRVAITGSTCTGECIGSFFTQDGRLQVWVLVDANPPVERLCRSTSLEPLS